MLGLCGCTGFSLIAVYRLLISVASPVAEHRLKSCDTWALLLCGTWDLPGPGIKPMSAALAVGFFTSAPPEKPWCHLQILKLYFQVLTRVEVTEDFCEWLSSQRLRGRNWWGNKRSLEILQHLPPWGGHLVSPGWCQSKDIINQIRCSRQCFPTESLKNLLC